MDCPGHHGAGSHPLLFQFHRSGSRMVQYGGAAGGAPVSVLPGGGIHPYPQPKTLFCQGLHHLHLHVGPAVFDGLRRGAGAPRWLLPPQWHHDDLCDPDGDLAGHRLAGGEEDSPGPCRHHPAAGLALDRQRAVGAIPGTGRAGGISLLFLCAHVGDHRGQQLAGAGDGPGTLLVPQKPENPGGRLLRLLSAVRRGVYGLDGLVPA